MMDWKKDCRYKVYGRLANSERGLVLVFDLGSAVMFDPLPEEYFDKRSGKMKKRINKYYPDEIRMKLGRSYSDYEATQRRSSLSPCQAIWIQAAVLFLQRYPKKLLPRSV